MIYWVILLDKLKIFRINRKFYVFLIGILVLGILFGSILPIFLSADDKKLVSEYLFGFVSDIKNGVNSLFLLSNGLISNLLFCLIIWLLGISVIGIPIVLFMFFYKCFIIGFSISSIIINYGFKGILFSFVYVFPYQIVSILSFILLTSYSMIFSIKLLLYILKKNDFNIRSFFRKYLLIFGISSFLIFLSVIYEAFINPYVLGFVFKLLGI